MFGLDRRLWKHYVQEYHVHVPHMNCNILYVTLLRSKKYPEKNRH